MAISRNWVNVNAQMDANSLAKRYDEMIGKVLNMLNEEGPTYSTWIRFQIGKKAPITFTTGSTDQKQNLIADLEIDKSGAGIANSFKLNITYDPFNYGQNPDDRIELLDDLVANAMSFDITADEDDAENTNDLNSLRGYIQYGYSCATDSKLVSPKYQFIMTNATSSIQMGRGGLMTYTFEGTSDLAIDCDYNIPFPEFKDKNLLEIVTTVLYCYYGDDAHKPSHVIEGLEYVENEYKYQIEIAEELYTEAKTVTVAATAAMSPWQYCKQLFSTYISQPDSEDERYKNLITLKSNERPYYQLYITDTAGEKIIHVTYISPLKDDNVSLDYEFTWSLDAQSIVQEWNPQVDLQLYLIRKAMALRKARSIIKSNLGDAVANAINNSGTSIWEAGFNAMRDGKIEFGDSKVANWLEGLLNNSSGVRLTGAIGSKLTDSIQGINIAEINEFFRQLEENSQIVDEMYDAELTIIGIPADLPIACEIRVKPRLLTSISRTAGVYRVTQCTDRISSKGIFESQIKLLRIKSLNED